MHFMNTMFGRVLASSVAALLASTSLYAIPKGPCDQKPDVCCDEPKPGPFAFVYPTDLGLACPRDFYVRVEGLAFQAAEDGLEFAIEDSNGSTVPLTRGNVYGFSGDNNGWDWNPGARFALGFILDHDAWALDFAWTWLNITNYKHANATTASGVIIPLHALGTSDTSLQAGQRSSASWDVGYNTIDARLGKPYHVSRYLIFNPHMGVRFAWIDQHFAADYQGSSSGGIGTNRFISHNDNDFWGIGARVGLDTDWVLGKGWSLFGNIATSMLYGKFDTEQHLLFPTSPSDGFDLDNDFYQNVPNMEIALGIGWGKYFDRNKYHIAVKAAYEFHEWWDQLNIRKFYSGSVGGAGTSTTYANDVVSRGNLTLNGFSLRIQLDI